MRFNKGISRGKILFLLIFILKSFRSKGRKGGTWEGGIFNWTHFIFISWLDSPRIAFLFTYTVVSLVSWHASKCNPIFTDMKITKFSSFTWLFHLNGSSPVSVWPARKRSKPFKVFATNHIYTRHVQFRLKAKIRIGETDSKRIIDMPSSSYSLMGIVISLHIFYTKNELLKLKVIPLQLKQETRLCMFPYHFLPLFYRKYSYWTCLVAECLKK